MKDDLTTYCLQSSNAVYAPGIVAWAINGYAYKIDRKHLIKIINETWGVPKPAAKALLAKKVPYRIKDETVIFTVGQTTAKVIPMVGQTKDKAS